MSQRGFEHSQRPPVEEQLDVSHVLSLTKENIELFVIECYEEMRLEPLKELLKLLYERLMGIDDESSPVEAIEISSLITYTEKALNDLNLSYDAIENYANGYSSAEK